MNEYTDRRTTRERMEDDMEEAVAAEFHRPHVASVEHIEDESSTQAEHDEARYLRVLARWGMRLTGRNLLRTGQRNPDEHQLTWEQIAEVVALLELFEEEQQNCGWPGP